MSKVPFPEVTVCPPPGSNTALNHDLMTAGNITIDNETRTYLLEMAISKLQAKPQICKARLHTKPLG